MNPLPNTLVETSAGPDETGRVTKIVHLDVAPQKSTSHGVRVAGMCEARGRAPPCPVSFCATLTVRNLQSLDDDAAQMNTILGAWRVHRHERARAQVCM